mgnify:CR=1 FL=1
MGNYRRWRRPWGCYFLTLATARRRPLFRSPATRTLLRQAFRKTLCNWPMDIWEFVLLPDHLHLLCSVPNDAQDYSTPIRLVKHRFTRTWLANGGSEAPRTASSRRRGIRGVWQKRFYEHTIRNQREYRAHVAYVHMNPVKHGLVERPADWPWSTFQRHVREGLLPADWTGPCELPGVGECTGEVW